MLTALVSPLLHNFAFASVRFFPFSCVEKFYPVFHFDIVFLTYVVHVRIPSVKFNTVHGINYSRLIGLELALPYAGGIT